ncbi:MAG: hypothetical protein ACT4QD_26480 [Acidobacteriota bacterium]
MLLLATLLSTLLTSADPQALQADRSVPVAKPAPEHGDQVEARDESTPVATARTATDLAEEPRSDGREATTLRAPFGSPALTIREGLDDSRRVAQGLGPHTFQAPGREVAQNGGHVHTLATRVDYESFGNLVPAAQVVSVATGFQLRDGLRITGRGQRQRKFDLSETRAGGSVEWQPQPSWTLTADLLGGPGNQVLPVLDASGRGAWSRRRTTIGLVARHLKFAFPDTRVWIVEPEVTVRLHARVDVTARVARTITHYAAAGGPWSHNNSAFFASRARVFRQLTLDAGYARGVDSLNDDSPDRSGRFRAHTVVAGGEYTWPSFTTIRVHVERQHRNTGLRIVQLSAGIVQRF